MTLPGRSSVGMPILWGCLLTLATLTVTARAQQTSPPIPFVPGPNPSLSPEPVPTDLEGRVRQLEAMLNASLNCALRA